MTKSQAPTVPERMRHLPVNRAGYVVPWFVAWIDGKPDFRVIRTNGILTARDGLCWLCGRTLGRYAAFVIGPMCAINRTSAEPPSHRDCATYAARVCPFLTNPNMVRRDNGKPAEVVDPAGVMIPRNPGVALVWVTRSWQAFMAPSGGSGLLFDVGIPTDVGWYAEGREATHPEVMASIESGLPLLRNEAEAEGPDAVAALESMTTKALELLPAVAS